MSRFADMAIFPGLDQPVKTCHAFRHSPEGVHGKYVDIAHPVAGNI